MIDEPHWHKSSYSSNGGNCIEVAANLAPVHGVVPVRDSKVPAGPVLSVSDSTWTAFVDGVKGSDI
ncbi:DUF397 domain-containing protein [Streptomyces sp. NBC_01500]|uniref:DUF397 domain-containing protein n=1 Tax=Streptomyces sp. NBC_01500 TaxID=2903886 RepID=UPI00224ED6B5|nr:DUF397 domain-containing protein [Streptomyces sp. NBC_01500]MCX4554164.1 DUF397 domain-containing protein [Streptomyces sp. NBC_01500]